MITQPLPAENSKCIWTQKITTRIYKPERQGRKKTVPLFPQQRYPSGESRGEDAAAPWALWWSDLCRAGAAPAALRAHPARRGLSVPTQTAREINKMKYEPVQWLQTGTRHGWGSQPGIVMQGTRGRKSKGCTQTGRCWRGMSKVSKIIFYKGL